MSTPESLVKALASGLVEALLATSEKPKPQRPAVVKTDDVKAAVAAYLGNLLQQEAPEQPDLFAQGDIGEDIVRRVEAARARAAGNGEVEPPPGTFNPDLAEGMPWTSPVK